MRSTPWLVALAGLVLAVAVHAQPADSDPPLPPGLGESAEPALPPGLGEEESVEAEAESGVKKLAERLPEGLHGFADLRAGSRTQSDPAQSNSLTLGELRLQAHYVRAFKPVAFDGTLDLVSDAVTEEVEFDLRELSLTFRPGRSLDLRLGRQIITWGTGDLIFINDLFPKDWQSFLIGRDDAYLKAPSNSLRVGWFAGKVSVDAVVTPRFEPDRYITGERLSFWEPFAGEFRGDDPPIAVDEPSDPEIALRIYGSAGSYEVAGYAHRGFWKSPGGVDPVAGVVTFPDLSVWGASGRGPLGPGIGNIELGYYDSREDRSGRDPFVNNSEFRFLAGYELELAREFTGGFQYYVEHMLDYDAYRSAFPAGEAPRNENRHVLTMRLTRWLKSQTMTASLFTFYSPSDSDGYLRPEFIWEIGDPWLFEVGANVFVGRDDATFFGQFTNNSNVYAAVRWRI